MHVIFMGPQGVGKGTQATRIAEQLELVHVSTGELFRNAIKAKTPLGIMAKEILDRGDLVPDDITLGIVETRLEEIAEMRSASGYARGALFDGFPRTPAQAKGLDDLLEHRGERLVTVIEITAPRDVLVERLSGRRVCRIAVRSITWSSTHRRSTRPATTAAIKSFSAPTTRQKQFNAGCRFTTNRPRRY